MYDISNKANGRSVAAEDIEIEEVARASPAASADDDHECNRFCRPEVMSEQMTIPSAIHTAQLKSAAPQPSQDVWSPSYSRGTRSIIRRHNSVAPPPVHLMPFRALEPLMEKTLPEDQPRHDSGKGEFDYSYPYSLIMFVY